MNKAARRGDYSSKSFLELVRSRYGISIVCHIDKERRWEAPNPRFCGARAGGRSLATYKVLWQLYNELPTDERKRAFIASKHCDGNRFFIIRNDDLVVYSCDEMGEFEAKVFVGKDSPYFERVKELYRAIETDNKVEPEWNALAAKV